MRYIVHHWNMRIQEKKTICATVYTVAFAVLLFTVVTTAVERKFDVQEPLLAYLVDSGEINQETAELLWVNCKHELSQAKLIFQDLESKFLEEKSSNSEELLNGWLSSTRTHDAVRILRPQVKTVLLDCLQGKNLLHPSTGEEKGSDKWYSRYLDFLFTQQLSSRRRELVQSSGEAPSPALTLLAPSPAPSMPPAPSPQQEPANAPILPFFPPAGGNSDLQPTAGDDPPADASDVQSSNQKTSRRTVIIAVTVTAFVTLVVASLLFFCCRRCCRTGSGRKNDERPLLSLSLSDYSVASLHKSYELGTPVKEEKLGNQSFNNKLSRNEVNGNFYVESHSLSNSKIDIPVGRTVGAATNSEETSIPISTAVSGAPGLPPLKPPPGRTYPPKPQSSNTAPPPPPPPASAPRPPPPPIKPPSGANLPKAGAPPPPPMPSGAKAGPRPPPPPGAGPPPPRPPPIGLKPPRPVASATNHPSTSTSSEDSDAGAAKAKLKPFFWDKVLANPDQSMVWHQIKSGSFQFNEEMIETLFGYAAAEEKKNAAKKETPSQDPSNAYIQIIDPKKSQNLAILLKALNVTTEEVCDALEEGNELPSELIQTLLKMAPTAEEELKLRLYSGELSQLGSAERFLKILVDIPFAFKRLESLLFMCTLQEETSTLKQSFRVLEAACAELRKSRLFLKLLEAVLKTGNRMNDGTFRGGAQAFKLDTLLKLSDVKGKDGKTTLLHFVVQEIVRSEGLRAVRAARETRSLSSFKSDDLIEDSTQDSDEHLKSLGLQVVSGLSGELENVKKAAILDSDNLTGTVANLGNALVKARDFLNSDMKNVSEENGFHMTLKSFVQNAEVDVMWLLEEEKRIMALVKSTGDYFHGKAGKDEGLRLFVIVRDFLIILDKVCREVRNAPRLPSTIHKKEDSTSTPKGPQQTTPIDHRQRLFPAITDRRTDSSSSDDES